ncbi:hypothetical protein KDX38_28330 [Pseudomonas sp. CDFA 602]|uniref:hypothetical protein n=1 Tax=Pseudomonas californiensis TaxID=2829823 RepID=UPI001E45642C|nr:hypothetical protein [Pseudomonas californiensis]MCD5997446.1 hypothetical protein [Pseudomonas californiensis]MCD6003062.1 hypothetical protein [Pseudomonas californiensis]
MHLNETIDQWIWDGVSIVDMENFSASLKLDLFNLVEQYFPEGWPESVPEEYRGWVFGPVYGKGDDCPEGYKRMLHILAIDQAGKALTLQGACDLYQGADGYKIVVTTAPNAMAMAEEYSAVVNA